MVTARRPHESQQAGGAPSPRRRSAAKAPGRRPPRPRSSKTRRRPSATRAWTGLFPRRRN